MEGLYWKTVHKVTYSHELYSAFNRFLFRNLVIWSLECQQLPTGCVWNTVEPRYLEFAYFELPLISKWKSSPCFNMKLGQQVTK